MFPHLHPHFVYQIGMLTAWLAHMDANTTPDPTNANLKSLVTIQVYLDSTENLEGGATVFYEGWGGGVGEKTVRIEAVNGRAVVFGQWGMCHAGEEVRVGGKVTVRGEVMYELVEDGEGGGQ